jgi:hypothetical protein
MSKCQSVIVDLIELGLDVEVEEEFKLPKSKINFVHKFIPLLVSCFKF